MTTFAPHPAALYTPPGPPSARCVLPPRYLGRTVTVVIEKVGSRWQVGGLDPVASVVYPVTFDGFTGTVRFATRKACVEMLAAYSIVPGDALWAMPEIRS